MDKKVFVIGCTHFGHVGALHWPDGAAREFESVEEMDETIIERWNNVVGENDIVYHLGDVFFYKKKPQALKTITRLNGEKRLVLGNHDNEHLFFYMQHKGNDKMFKDVYVDLPLDDYGVILSHRPLDKSQLWSFKTESKLINIHAHVHKKTLEDTENYFNACAENIDYTPQEITEIVKKVIDN